MRKVMIPLYAAWLVIGIWLFTAMTSQAQDDQPPEAPTQTPWIIYLEAPTATPMPETPTYITVTLPTEEPPSFLLAKPVELESAVIAGGSVEELLQEVDQDIAVIWPTVVLRQSRFFEMTRGRYWQGLATHDDPPADGNPAPPDNWWDHPSDQPFEWRHINILPYTPLAYSVQMDVYDGPYGPGYIARFQITIDGLTYERTIVEGGEVFREEPWHVIE